MKNLELASPSEMSASARAGEIAAILAAGDKWQDAPQEVLNCKECITP